MQNALQGRSGSILFILCIPVKMPDLRVSVLIRPALTLEWADRPGFGV
jgi:hypothetical protein